MRTVNRTLFHVATAAPWVSACQDASPTDTAEFTDPRDLESPREGSLADRFRRAGTGDAFLDMRNIAEGGDWLRGDLWARPMGHVYQLATWPRHIDGIIYIPVTHRSTPGGMR